VLSRDLMQRGGSSYTAAHSQFFGEKMAINWICPYCDRAQSVVDKNIDSQDIHLSLSDLDVGYVGVQLLGVNCANEECRKLTLHVVARKQIWIPAKGDFQFTADEPDLASIRLLPLGSAKPQPEYIPQAIRDDYAESCLIIDLSPKAAATLARRALQGMIRDFCGIVRNTLDAEIKALDAAITDGTAPRAVSVESVQAIDHVRKVGNIGAHMEKDISVIIDVDPGEARALIDLVELLLREWYVDRHSRQERLAKVAQIRDEKDQAKLAGPASVAALPSP